MTINRRNLMIGAAALGAPSVVTSARAQASVVTLKLHHFLPPVSNGHAKMLAPWAKQIETDSAGKIFPAMWITASICGTVEWASCSL